MFVIKLISASVDILPVFQFLRVKPSLKFRGKLVALDLRVEFVVDGVIIQTLKLKISEELEK